VTAHFSIGLYLLASTAFFLDLLDLLLRLYLRREQTVPGRSQAAAATSVPLEVGAFTPYEVSMHVRPYAIVAAIHNLDREALAQFLAAMQPYHDHLWIIDDASTDDTCDRLQAARVHSIRSDRNRLKPGSIKALLTQLPPEIETVMVVDPDARILSTQDDFLQVLFEFQRSGMAAVCPRICIQRGGLLARFQQLEYSMSFSIGRKALADFTITSGIALYRRDALQRTLEHHTLSVYAEDLENALLLLLDNERVYYDGRLVVETDGISTIRGLLSQRVGWSFGLIKVYAHHWRELLSQSRRGLAFTYQYVVYMGVFVLLFHPLKVGGIVVLALSAANGVAGLLGVGPLVEGAAASPLYFLAVYVKYTLLALAAVPLSVRRSERLDVLPIVPLYTFYAIAQVVPATLGYLNWCTVRAWGWRVYRDHYEPARP
jgi:cellulose synthase/poly-beta-1,6-N-acetylglucosamine synthase-like glycosyltransferase